MNQIMTTAGIPCAPVTPLTAQCPACDGFGRVYPFNPDVRSFRCEACDGTGAATVDCSGCREDAVERIGGTAWCARCAAEFRASLEEVG